MSEITVERDKSINLLLVAPPNLTETHCKLVLLKRNKNSATFSIWSGYFCKRIQKAVEFKDKSILFISYEWQQANLVLDENTA